VQVSLIDPRVPFNRHNLDVVDHMDMHGLRSIQHVGNFVSCGEMMLNVRVYWISHLSVCGEMIDADAQTLINVLWVP